MNGHSTLGKKKRMRSFFWKTIPEEQVRGKTNIWTLAAQQQHHYQIDTKTVEELFGQQEDPAKSSLPRRGGSLNSSFKDAREEVSECCVGAVCTCVVYISKTIARHPGEIR
jgi:hypothetical protein